MQSLEKISQKIIDNIMQTQIIITTNQLVSPLCGWQRTPLSITKVNTAQGLGYNYQ